MPKLSGDTLLQRAIPLAVQDRESLAGCYASNAPQHAECLEQAQRVKALKGRKLDSLDEAGRETAFLAFVCAESWEQSLADANHGEGPVARACLRNARLFREFRLAAFGRTALEAALADARPVPVESGR